MAITIINRWNGGSRDAIVPIAKRAKAALEKAGAESFQMSQIHTGPHAGQWVTATRYSDWETYGKTTQALASNAAYQKILADVGAKAQLADRMIIVGVDL
jgi:hypothetical protein